VAIFCRGSRAFDSRSRCGFFFLPALNQISLCYESFDRRDIKTPASLIAGTTTKNSGGFVPKVLASSVNT
jgi:hypothetical protein